MPAESPQQSALRQVLTTLKDPSVRALAWSVLSAPLITSSDESVHLTTLLPTLELDSLDRIIRFFIAEEQKPQRLQQHLAQRSSHFLGPYFESLWAYFFQHTERYEIVAHNLQIHHQGKTLGEFDFILWDSKAKRHIHVELAAKFYLQIRNCGVNNKYFPHSTMSWIGPNQIDRLDLKVSALLEKQLNLAEHPIAQSHLKKLNIGKPTTRTLLKGMLFPKITCPDTFLAQCLNFRDQGNCGWLTRSNFCKWISGSKGKLPGFWSTPDKLAWLSPSYHPLDGLRPTATLNDAKMKQFLTSIEDENRPKMLTYIDTLAQLDTTRESDLNQELFRLFVTPDDWPGKQAAHKPKQTL